MRIRRKIRSVKPAGQRVAWLMAATAMVHFSAYAPERVWGKEPGDETDLDRKGTSLRDRAVRYPATALSDERWRTSDRARSQRDPNPMQVAMADTDKQAEREFDILPQSLASALRRFGEQAGVQFAYTTEDVSDVRTGGVSGHHTSEDALRLLLRDTGMRYRITGANTITLEKQGLSSSADVLTAPAVVLQPIDSPNSGGIPGGAKSEQSQKPVKVQEIVVKDKVERQQPSDAATPEYKADYSSTVTRSSMSIDEAPTSIGVITRNVIRDTFARTQSDAFEAVSGVTRSTTYGRGESINIRGFESNNRRGSFNAMRGNGLPIDGMWAPDWGIVERYEIIKGPASIVGGASTPGGLINRISKTPQRENFTTTEFQAGSYGLRRGMIDANGMLSGHEDIRGRLVFAVEDGGNFVDNTPVRQYTVAPSVEFDLFKGAGKLLVLGMYQRFDGATYPGYPLLNDGTMLNIPRTSNFGGGAANGARTTYTGYSGEVHYDHKFIQDIKLSVKGKYSNSYLSDKTIYSYSPGGLPRNGDSYFNSALQQNRFDTYAGELFLSKGFDLWGQKHEVLAGVDYRRMSQNYLNGYIYLPAGQAPILDNVFNPRNLAQAPVDQVFVDAAIAQNRVYRQQLKQLGAFAQVILRPVERLTLVFAGRHDRADQSNLNKVTGEQDNGVKQAWTGRFGATYKVAEWMHVYGGVQQSFQPQFGITSNGSVIQPETGINYEVGAKVNLLQERLRFTTALFRTYRENVLNVDPNNNRFSIAVGEQRHQGVEFDVNGQPIPGLNLNANLAVMDAKITKDNNLALVGQRAFAPEYVGRIFGTYQLQSGPLEGFGFGGGVYFIGDYAQDLPNRVRANAYERVDAVLFYRGSKRWDVSFNLRNLLNAKYIENPGTINWANRFGAPISAFGTLRIYF